MNSKMCVDVPGTKPTAADLGYPYNVSLILKNPQNP